MKEFRQWMSDCQDEWQSNRMFAANQKPEQRTSVNDAEPAHSSKTDVQKTWRKFGWTPIGEQK